MTADIPRTPQHYEGSLLQRLHQAREEGPRGEQALESLLEALYVPVKRFAKARLKRFGDAEEIAADVAQETLFHVARYHRTCTAVVEGQLMMWVLVTARRVMIDMLRSPGSGLAVRALCVELRRDNVSESFESSIGKRPEAAAAHELALGIAIEAYGYLPQTTAELLWDRLVGGAEWNSIATQYGTTYSAAKRRFQRAQGALRREVLRRIRLAPSLKRVQLEQWLASTGTSGGGAPILDEGD